MIKFDNVSYSYPFLQEKALNSLSFSIKKGSFVLFTGSSGCGKSTLVRVLNGLIPHYYEGNLEGHIYLNNKNTQELSSEEHFALTGTLFQDPENQYFTLQVNSEIDFGMQLKNYSIDKIKSIRDKMITNFGLNKVEQSDIFSLSEGEKQKVAMASIFAVDPKIIILDEPSANLDPKATMELANFLADLKTKGYTIIVVDHRIYWLQNIVDKIFIMRNGTIAKELTYKCLVDNSALIKEFGLRATSVCFKKNDLPIQNQENSFISLNAIDFGYKKKELLFTDFSLNLPRGIIISITGKNGAGKTTLGRLIAGLLKVKKGTITIDKQPQKSKNLLKRVSIVQQNSDHQLFMKTVKDELLMSNFKISQKRKEELTEFYLNSFCLKDFENRHPQSLSGGQKQRLVIACGLMKEPDIIILDEPTSGLDGKNMNIISDILSEKAKSGVLVLLISHDLELLNKLSTYNLELN